MDIRSSVKPPANLPEGVLAFMTAITAALKDPQALAPLAEIAEKINGVNKLTQEEADTRDEAIRAIQEARNERQMLADERQSMQAERAGFAGEKAAHEAAGRAVDERQLHADERDGQYDKQRKDFNAELETHRQACAAMKLQMFEVRAAENRNKIEAERLAALRVELESQQAKMKQAQSILGNGHDERTNTNGLVPVQPGQRADASS